MKTQLRYLLLGSVILSSCQEANDSSYEREVIKLKAEREMAKAQLKEKESRLTELNNELQTLRTELAQKTTEVESNTTKDTKVDTHKVRLGLMDAVDELKKKLETEKQHIKVKNYSLDKLEINTEYPFNATVKMEVYSSESNAQSTLYWEAKGDLMGQWILSNTGKPIVKNSAVASNNKSSTPNNTKPAAKPNTPAKKPNKPMVRRPNEHIIDWSKVK